MASYRGGCHCGAVRFELELDGDPRDVRDCNCSICTKKGFLHLIVPEAALRATGPTATYRFGTRVATHMFCPTCGIHAYYRPRSHPDKWDVNVRCLDGVPLSHWRISSFDGQHWEAARAALDEPSPIAPATTPAIATVPALSDTRAVVQTLARNNAWANHRLHAAIARLDDAAYRAPRTSFFPSIHRTLSHILLVDELYTSSLEGHPVELARLAADYTRFDAEGTFAEVRARQAAMDRRLLAIARTAALDATVAIPRERGLVRVDTAAAVLLHVFLHDVHHRGQIHAMLSGTAVAPPQLDEGILLEDLPRREAELRALDLGEY
jgi:uncharacterized damage-inducible protein DinB